MFIGIQLFSNESPNSFQRGVDEKGSKCRISSSKEPIDNKSKKKT